jgi:hypothetical protein
MKIQNTNKIRIVFIAMGIILLGCGKDYLNEKPNSKIIQPQALDEFQLLLENYQNNFTCDLPLLSSDEIEYISFPIWQAARTNADRNSYIWAKDIFEGETTIPDWKQQYSSIFCANNVLAGLENINKSSNTVDHWRFIKGWALFCRAYNYFDLIKNFSPAYNAARSGSLPGVPIKLNPSIDEILPRSTQQESYDRILTDLSMASNLLDRIGLPLGRNQPSKISCHALAARIYLSMGDYSKAESFADSTLQLYDKLIDYNIVSLTNASPFLSLDAELIYSTGCYGSSPSLVTTASNTRTNVPEKIINLYHRDDLRLPIYFSKRTTGGYFKKRGYQRSGSYPFTGLATDEVYLIKSECAARRGDKATSLKYLNNLLINRFKAGTFVAISISDQQKLIDKVVEERQKELVWRGLRWDDLKRLNRDGANITLTRVLNDVTYTLPPNDPRYVFPIPDFEINLSNIQQNQR